MLYLLKFVSFLEKIAKIMKKMSTGNQFFNATIKSRQCDHVLNVDIHIINQNSTCLNMVILK